MKLKVVLSALLALTWVLVVWLWVRTSRQDAALRKLAGQLRAARTRVSPPPAPALVPTPAVPAPAEKPEKKERPAPEPAVDPETEILRAKVQESGAALARAQARISELETQVLNIMAERARATAAGKDAEERIAELTRSLDAANAERPAMEKRARDLETEVGRLRDQAATSSQKAAQFEQMSGELRDITRRQQVYVNNILRRYREVTDIFRSLPGMMESKGNGPEVSRIQTAISMADEDVRQLNDLSGRLNRLEKRIR